MPDSHVIAVILAAGKGTRMHSDKPKVLQTLLGQTMLRYAADAAGAVAEQVLTVVGHGREMVEAAHPDLAAGFVVQTEQKGTGHALQVAWERVRASGASHCLVLNGDTPLVTPEDLAELIDAVHEGADVAFLSTVLEQSGSFGRVVRGTAGEVIGIVEAKDFDPNTHGPDTGEVNTGLFCLRVIAVDHILFDLTTANKSGELYITDLVGLAVNGGLHVHAQRREGAKDLMGVNSPLELSQAEEHLRTARALEHLAAGVLIHHPQSVVIGPRAIVEPGAELTGPCRILGKSHVERGARIGAFSQLTDSHVAAGAEVREYCHLEGADLASGVIAGPYARLRPGAVLQEGARVGNFVEMKKSVLGPGAKASHLTYLGDAEVGAKVNIGAGTITCNYDGVNKHKTVIGEGAFIGSNTALVAPVTVGKNALVGAGSTITKNVPDGGLAIARSKQANMERRGRKS